MAANEFTRPSLPTVAGSVIWAYAGGTHSALFARDDQAGPEGTTYNWIALDYSATWVKGDDIRIWEPRFCPAPSESTPPADLPAPVSTSAALPSVAGSVIWGYSARVGWTLFARCDLGDYASNWVSLGAKCDYFFDEEISYAEIRFYPTITESSPRKG